MGKFTKRLTTGLAAVLAMSFGASANVLIDDFRSGTNLNRMGQYWYYYTNLGTKGGAGNTTINEWNMGTSVRRNYSDCVGARWETIMHLDADQRISTRGQADFEMVFKPTSSTLPHGAARQGSNRPVNAMMAFQMPMGPNTTGTDAYTCNPGVGMGTNLTQDPASGVQKPIGSDFSTVTHINFYARVSHAAMPVKFKVETAKQLEHIEQPNLLGTPGNVATSKKLADGAYNSLLKFDAADTWKRFSVAVTGDCNLSNDDLGGTAVTNVPRRQNCVGDLMRAPFEVYGAESWHDPADHQAGLAQVNYQFAITDAVKIAWYVQGEDWVTPAGETAYLYIDSVWTTGGTFNLPGDCPTCMSTTMTPPANAWKLSDFDNEVYEPTDGTPGFLSQNALGGPWYAFTDVADAGAQASTISWGLWYDPLYLVYPASHADAGKRCPPTETICIQGGSGLNVEGYTVGDILRDQVTEVTAAHFGNYDDWGDNKAGYEGSNGAAVQFTLGQGWVDGGTAIQGFVGIGAKLTEFDSQRFDATGVQGIWFMYKTDFSGDAERQLIVSVVDRNAEIHGAEATYSAKIPTTGGEWRAANIPFSVFAVPLWSEWTTPLNLTHLVEVQFRHDGVGYDGSIAIDNVYLLGQGNVVSVKHNFARANKVAPALRASFNRGSVNVNWNAPAQISSGRITLVNARGVTVASQSINASGSNVAATLTAKGNMPAGMYFVRIDARDVKGKRVVQQTPVNIVK